MSSTETIKEAGSKLGMDLRSGQSAEVGCTDRIKRLSVILHCSRPNLELHRTRVFTEYFSNHESESQLRRRYFAMANVYRTMPIFIVEGERLLGWQGGKVRCNNFSIESHAHWLESDFDTFETRAFDPWLIDAEDKQELKEIHIPYWRDKTLTSKFRAQTRCPDILLGSGYVDCSNYISNPGSHFVPDYYELLKIGYKGYYEKAKALLAKLDLTDPDNVTKTDFYEGMMEVCLGIKEYGSRLHAHAKNLAKNVADKNRRAELEEAGRRSEKICWDIPETFAEALHMLWINTMLLNVEASGPCINLGRLDQLLWPYLEADLEAGRETVDSALEWMEEFNIKCCNIPWLLPEGLAHCFGGYYRWAGGYSLGGYDANGNDAVNLLSYICLRSARETRTTAPAVHVHIGSKTPESFLQEAVKLSAEGLGHPSFFDIDSVYSMIQYNGAGLNGCNNLPLKLIRERATTVGCVEPKIAGYCYGHTNANITNLGDTISLTLTNGVLPKGCAPCYGAGEQIGCASGDPVGFETFDDFYAAVMRQFRYQINLCHEHMLVAERILTEEHQMPLFTMMTTDAIEKGEDVVAGGAILNSGPHYMLSGVADLGDSLAAVKKLVYDDKVITMKQLLKAVEADFVGYEDIRKLCLEAPKYGNDIDYVDELTSRALQDCVEYCATLKCYRAGNYSSAGIQPTQTNVAMGEQCWALPSGRKALTPLADTLSAEQHMDVNGPLAALRSYGKINHRACTNGTILNMWISKTDLVTE